MNMLVLICCLTAVIAIASLLRVGSPSLQGLAMPWTAGVLLGIGFFWTLPEVAGDLGCVRTLTGVSGILLILRLIDRYGLSICPFCTSVLRSPEPSNSAAHRHANRFVWPLLTFGCIHSLFDGWTIALSQAASLSKPASALSWGAAIHKIPESVAIGVLAARVTSSRGTGMRVVLLIQAVMTTGGLLALNVGNMSPRWADMSTMPASAFLLLFGLLAIQQDWRLHGRLREMRAAAPGLLGCGLAALVSAILGR